MRPVNIACVPVLWLVMAAAVPAEPPQESVSPGANELTITATGRARAPADSMLITLTSTAGADKATKAYQRCKTEADAAVKAIEALNIKNIRIRRSPFQFTVPARTILLQPDRDEPVGNLDVYQRIEILVPEIAKLEPHVLPEIASRIIDAAQTVRTRPGMRHAYGYFGGEGLFNPVLYAVEDSAPLRDKAAKAAIRRAIQLKDVVAQTGIRVGQLKELRIEGVGDEGWSDTGTMIMVPYRRGLIVSDEPDNVSAVCSVTVVYEIPEQIPGADAEEDHNAGE